MTRAAIAARGEARIEVGTRAVLLRPSFAALCAAEEALGPLFALVERAAAGRLTLAETAALFACCADGTATREEIGEAVAEMGLAKVAPVLRVLLGQILQGRT